MDDIDTLQINKSIIINGKKYIYSCMEIKSVFLCHGPWYNYNVFKKVLGIFWKPVYCCEGHDKELCVKKCKNYLKKLTIN